MAKPGLDEVAAVIAVARLGSFRAAALELRMSTTGLSNAVGKLERSVGVRLFNRTTRSVSLTDAGRRFVERATPALADLRAAMDVARSQQETPSGVLRINAFATAGREVLTGLLTPFLRRYPEVHVDLVTEGRLVDIVAAGFDLGVRSADLVPSDMIAVALGSPRRYAVVGSPVYFRERPAPETPSDLFGHACIRARLPDGRPLRWRFEKDGEPVLVDVAGPITLDEASLTRLAVLDGMGIGFFLEADVRDDLASGRLVSVLQAWTPTLAPLALYYPDRRNPSAAFRALIAAAREYAARAG